MSVSKFTVSESTIMFGLHEDTKPTGDNVVNGSAFIEIDTSTIYFYDAEGSQWLEWGAAT